jgi:hypothetical protein
MLRHCSNNETPVLERAQVTFRRTAHRIARLRCSIDTRRAIRHTPYLCSLQLYRCLAHMPDRGIELVSFYGRNCRFDRRNELILLADCDSGPSRIRLDVHRSVR